MQGGGGESDIASILPIIDTGTVIVYYSKTTDDHRCSQIWLNFQTLVVSTVSMLKEKKLIMYSNIHQCIADPE